MEGFSQPFQVNLSLKKLSATSIVTCLCKHPDIKKKIRKSIANKKKDKGFPANGVRNGVIEILSKNIQSLKLPEELKPELEDVAILLGDELTRWIRYVTETLKLSITYTDKVYWTQLGLIDDFQIYKKFWLHDHKFGKLKDGILSFSLACIHADKNFIEESLVDMIVKSENFCHLDKICIDDQTINTIALYLYDFNIGLDESEEEDLGENKNENKNKLDVNDIFQLCISSAYVRAANYFYNLLNEKEKRKEIMRAAENCLEWSNYYESNDIRERKMAELLLWLINTMPVEQRHYFLMENIDEIMDVFLVSLPYQEIGLKILDEKWVDLITSKHGTMIESIIRSSNVEHLSKSASSRRAFQEAFRKMLKMASKKVKKDTFVYSRYNLEDCFDTFDVKYLSLIINDKDLEEDRDMMIAEANTKVKALIKSKNFEQVAGFILEVLASNKERRDYIEKYELLDKFLMSENLKTVEQILNFLITSANDDSVTILLTDLDGTDMCNRFLEKGRSDLVDKFLDWDYQERKVSFKKTLAKDWSICLHIFKIWATENSVEEAKKRTLSFLKFKYNSDAEINSYLKKELIKDDDSAANIFCLSLNKSWKGKNLKENDYAKKFDNFEELLKFCSKTPKDIKNIKKLAADDIERLWKIYGTNEKDFMTLKSLVNWIYNENKSEKEKVIKNYLNSRQGVIFLNAMRESVHIYGWDPFLNYLNTWHRSFANKKKMRKEMMPLDEVVFPPHVMGKLSALILSAGHTEKYTINHTKGLMALASDFGYKIYIEEKE